MARTDAYATATQYRNRIDKEDEATDDEINADLKAISRMLDAELLRPDGFGADATPQARVFVPDFTSQDLDVPAISSRTGVEIKVDSFLSGAFTGDAWATTDYELLPRNADLETTPLPFTRIHIPPWTHQLFAFVAGVPVQVKAKWGWPGGVPDGIVIATIELCGILRLETPRATGEINLNVRDQLAVSGKAAEVLQKLAAVYAGGSFAIG